MDQIEKLKQWISESNRIVFFGGAGVSTESGIKDFRSVDGLYNQKFEYPPEVIISHTFYKRKPAYFFNMHFEFNILAGRVIHTDDIKIGKRVSVLVDINSFVY